MTHRILDCTTFKCPCLDSRKSFYGKAWIIEDAEGNRYLQSYETIVCYLSADVPFKNTTFKKLWDDYSATTMRHINSFMQFCGYPSCGGKKWWEALEANREYTPNEFLNVGV